MEKNRNMNVHRRRAKHYFPKQSSYKDVFRIKPVPLNWFRGGGSALSVGIPYLIGFLLGDLPIGIMASIGGFTFLYVSNETYAQRAVRLFWIALGLTASFILGTLCSYNTVLMVSMFGVVGGLAIFLLGLFRMTGPGGMFFVLAYSVGTSMPHDLSSIGPNALCVLGGAMVAWLVGMAGVIVKPHGTETRAVSAVYYSLSKLLSSIGTEQFTECQHQTASLMKQADRTLESSRFFGKGERDKRLLEELKRLNSHVHGIFLSILNISLEHKHPIEEQLGEQLQVIGNQLHGRNKDMTFSVQLPEGEHSSALGGLYLKVKHASEGKSDPAAASRSVTSAEEAGRMPGYSAGFKEVLQTQSELSFTALRYAIVLLVSASVAYGFQLDRSYWVPLSTISVMSGGTYVGNLYRGIQRSAGTIAGVLIGAVLLWIHPPGFVFPFIMAALQFIVELIYGRNYSLAVMFITPSTLLIGTALQPEFTGAYFITARIVDILIGSAIALAGTMLLWRRASSNRLLDVFSDAVRREGELLALILANKSKQDRDIAEQRLQQALIQLRQVYDHAFAESLRRNAMTTTLWPAVADCLHLGYMLMGASYGGSHDAVPEERISECRRYFAGLSLAIANCRRPEIRVPDLSEYPFIHSDIVQLQHSLRVL